MNGLGGLPKNFMALLKPMRGASATTNGAPGIVPAPKAGDELRFLRGDGQWAGGGGSIDVTDGTTTVSPTTQIDFDPTYFDVDDGGAGKAEVTLHAPPGASRRQVRTVLWEKTLTTTGTFDTDSVDDAGRSGISQSYDYLVVEFSLRATTNAGLAIAYIFFNDDLTASNYRSQRLRSTSTAGTDFGSTPRFVSPTGATAPSNSFANGSGHLYDYSSATRFKTLVTFSAARYDTSTTNPANEFLSVGWHTSTPAAITRLRVQMSDNPTNVFEAGSWFRVIGVREEIIGVDSAPMLNKGELYGFDGIATVAVPAGPDFSVPIYDSSSLSGLRAAYITNENLVYNGAMSLWNGATTLVAPTSMTYDAEGFQHARSGTMVVNVARTTTVPDPDETLGQVVHSSLVRITTAQTSLATNDFLFYRHRMEGYTARALMGRPFVVSFWVRANIAGTFALVVRNSLPDQVFVTNYDIPTANTWFRVVKVIDTPPTTGTWDFETGVGLDIIWTLAAGTGLHTTTPNTWITANRIATSAQTNFAAAVNNDWFLTGVKVEPGTVATPMLPDPFEKTQLRASRYFYKSYREGVIPGTASPPGGGAGIMTAISTGTLWGLIQFPVPMRIVTPTVTIFANDGTAARVTNPGGGTVGTAALTALTIKDRGFSVIQDTGLPFTAGTLYTFNFTANARL